MNWAWWDGKMSVEHYREEHGLDSPTLREASRQESAESADVEQGLTARQPGDGRKPEKPKSETLEPHK